MASKRKSVVLSLIRCGETAWDAEGRLHGRSDLPLCEEGRASVVTDAVALEGTRIAAVHHAPDEAATETARIAARAAGARTKVVADLAATDLGLLDGLTEQTFAERYPKRYKQWHHDPVSLSPPDGEQVADARARLFAAAARLLRRSRSAEVALVVHPLGLGLLRCWLTDRPSIDVWTLIKTRPRIERYALGVEVVEWLEGAAKAQLSHS